MWDVSWAFRGIETKWARKMGHAAGCGVQINGGSGIIQYSHCQAVIINPPPLLLPPCPHYHPRPMITFATDRQTFRSLHLKINHNLFRLQSRHLYDSVNYSASVCNTYCCIAYGSLSEPLNTHNAMHTRAVEHIIYVRKDGKKKNLIGNYCMYCKRFEFETFSLWRLRMHCHKHVFLWCHTHDMARGWT